MSPGIRIELVFALGLAWVLAWESAALRGAAADEGFEARSVTLRTVLHHDAAQEAPFRELLHLYRRAGREEELRALYEGHLARYPADLGARAVWIRLLVEGDAPDAGERAREAARTHPENAWFQYLVYEATGELGPLERSVALETAEAKRAERLRELAGAATGTSERALAESAMKRELGLRSGQSADALWELAGWMRSAGFSGLSWEAVDQAWELGVTGEAEVVLALEGAIWAEEDRDERRRDRARERLGSLRERLAADHPRREEVILAWRELVADREEAINQAVAAWRADPAAAARGVDAAILLEAAGREKEAVEVWLELASRQPTLGQAVEKGRALLGDDLEGWIGFLDRIGQSRVLEERWVRERVVLEFRAGLEAGLQRLEEAIRSRDAGDVGRFLVALGEELLASGNPQAGAACYGQAWASGTGGFAALSGRVRALAMSGDGAALRGSLAELGDDVGTEEEWLALAIRLEEAGWEPEAAELIRRTANRPGAGVAVRLSRLERDAAEDTGARLEDLRREGLSGEDYRRWLIAMAEYWAGRGQAQEAWLRESTRLAAEIGVRTFDEETVGRWAVFAQVAKARSQGDRLRSLAEAAVPSGANEAGLPTDAAVRRLVAEAWEADPFRLLDAERLLLALERDDAARADEYRTRLALLAERSGRRDLALDRLGTVDGAEIVDAEMLFAAADLAEKTGLGPLEGRFRARLVALRPTDATAWERHLAVLLRERDEAGFRAAASTLLAPGGDVELGAAVRQALEDARFASWQRELAAVSPERRLGMLRSLLRASPSEEVRGWVEACQAWERLRSGEGSAAEIQPSPLVDLEVKMGSGATVNWAALAAIRSDAGKRVADAGSGAETVRSLLGPGWVFRCRADRRLLALCAGESHLILVDDRLVVRALDGTSGKVMWEQETYRPSGTGGAPGENGVTAAASGEWESVAAPPALEAWGGLVFTADDRRVLALEEQTGRIIWEATFGSARVGPITPGRVRCPIRLERAGEKRLAVLVPEGDLLAMLEAPTGKVLWEQETLPGLASWGPLGCALAASEALVAVLGDRLSVFTASDGRRAWSQTLEEPPSPDLDGVAESSAQPVRRSAIRHLALDGSRLLALDGERGYLLEAEFPGPGTVWTRSQRALIGFRGDTVAWAGPNGLEVAGAADGVVRFTVPGPGPGGWFGRQLVWGTDNGFAAFGAGNGRRGWRSRAEGESVVTSAVGENYVAAGRIRSERSGGREVRHMIPMGTAAWAGGLAWMSGSGTEVVWWKGEREP